MSDFVAHVGKDGRIRWPATVVHPGGRESVHYVCVCPAPIPTDDTRTTMAAELGIPFASIAGMKMVRVGPTDQLGNVGWRVYVVR